MVENGVGFIIQARLSSTRLPEKVLLPLPYNSPTTLLDQIIRRAQKSTLHPVIVLATSEKPENQVLAETAERNQVYFFQGSEEDVLARFYDAATKYEIETIVRLTADNPFIDSEIIDQTVRAHQHQKADYTVTTGLPLGTNIEVISLSALEAAYWSAHLPEHREHVTPYIKQNPQLFRLQTLPFHNDLLGSETWRLTVDNENDYALACLLYLLLYAQNNFFGLEQVATLIREQPWILYINRQNFQKKIFTHLPDEIQAGVHLLQQNDLPQAANLLAKNLT